MTQNKTYDIFRNKGNNLRNLLVIAGMGLIATSCASGRSTTQEATAGEYTCCHSTMKEGYDFKNDVIVVSTGKWITASKEGSFSRLTYETPENSDSKNIEYQNMSPEEATKALKLCAEALGVKGKL